MRAMMWVVIGAAILVAVIGGYCGYCSSEISNALREEVLALSQVIKSGDTATAMDATLRLEGEWQEKSAVLSLWVNHQDIDDVSVGIQQLKVSVEENETYYALKYLAELDEALSHIYHRDAFQLKNIL